MREPLLGFGRIEQTGIPGEERGRKLRRKGLRGLFPIINPESSGGRK